MTAKRKKERAKAFIAPSEKSVPKVEERLKRKRTSAETGADLEGSGEDGKVLEAKRKKKKEMREEQE
jgi:ribosomal RNA assembly protein